MRILSKVALLTRRPMSLEHCLLTSWWPKLQLISWYFLDFWFSLLKIAKLSDFRGFLFWVRQNYLCPLQNHLLVTRYVKFLKSQIITKCLEDLLTENLQYENIQQEKNYIVYFYISQVLSTHRSALNTTTRIYIFVIFWQLFSVVKCHEMSETRETMSNFSQNSHPATEKERKHTEKKKRKKEKPLNFTNRATF